VLYFFRSPSYVKIGRRPLDEESREALEHTHPDLSFDWYSLGRESQAAHVDERDKRPSRGGRSPQPSRVSAPEPAAPPAVVPAIDDSLLGRIAGAGEAARLRERYATLLQRISRRSRTPEERDRLSERAQRLNPDDWPDEAAAREGLQARIAEWDAVNLELPQRRRGRRGGRRRNGDAGEATPPAGSVILEGHGAGNDTEQHDSTGEPDWPADPLGDDARRGTGPAEDAGPGSGLPDDD
jgi:hypothetical protein